MTEKDIKNIKASGKGNYPMIVLTTPKGWTGPNIVEGKQIEGTFRAHQIPLKVDAEHPKNLTVLEKWLKSYHPEVLFDEEVPTGVAINEAVELAKSYGQDGSAGVVNGVLEKFA